MEPKRATGPNRGGWVRRGKRVRRDRGEKGEEEGGGGKRERSRADDRGGTGQGRKRRLEKREDG